MRSPQSQEARQSDRQARTLRILIVAAVLAAAAVAAAVLWWPAATPPETAAPAPAPPQAPASMMVAVGEALKDQGTIEGYAVAEADRALDLTLRADAAEDARAVAQATCDALQGKIDAGWKVRVYPAGGGAMAADCSL